MEYLTYQGNKSGTTSGATAYLSTLNGLEVNLLNDPNTLKSTSASTVTSSNIIEKLKEARNTIPQGVKNKSDFVYQLSSNCIDAYRDAISEKQS